MNKVLCIFCIFLFPLLIAGQESDYEYGAPVEMKGLTKYTIYVGAESEIFNQIKDEITQADVPGLTFVDDPANAEIVLVFSATGQGRQRFGKGYVAKNIGSRTRARILLSFEELRNVPFEKKPAIKFAREFVRLYKKANDLK